MAARPSRKDLIASIDMSARAPILGGSCYNTAHARPPSLRIHAFGCVRIAPVQGLM